MPPALPAPTDPKQMTGDTGMSQSTFKCRMHVAKHTLTQCRHKAPHANICPSVHVNLYNKHGSIKDVFLS